MRFKPKKLLFIFTLLIIFVVTIAPVYTGSYSSTSNKYGNTEISYLDLNLEEFKQSFEQVLEQEYGSNYREIVSKNVESTLLGNQVNEIFVSKETNVLEYPNYIGGLYIDDNNELVIQIKQDEIPLTGQTTYSTYNTMLALDDEIITKYVNHSYNELEDTYEYLNDVIVNSTITYSNIVAYYIDVVNNCIVVELLDNSFDKQEEFKNNILDSDIIEFKQGSVGELEAYNTGQATSNCTIGFRAKLGNISGFVTAGHCVSNLSIGSSYSSYGTLKAYQQSGSVDAAFIQTSTTINRNLQYPVYPVTSLSSSGYTTNLFVGTMVGKSGATTKGTSGKITSLNATWNGTSSISLTNMIQANYQSAGGDSGSPVFTLTGGNIVGVHRGTVGGLKYSSNYLNVRNALGVNIY